VKTELICEICGLIYFVYPYRKSSARYCSRKCLNKSKESIVRDKHQNWKGGKPKCATCDKSLSLYGSKHCKSHRVVADPERYRRLKGAATRRFWLGRKHTQATIEKLKRVHTTHGLTPVFQIIRGSQRYKDWRLGIFRRDWFKCVLCSSNKNIQADHFPKSFKQILNEEAIISSIGIPDDSQLWDVNNGRTLCYDCHRATSTWGVHNSVAAA
jgi:hypothetical protein